MKIPFGRPLLGQGEQEAVLRVLQSPQLVHGPEAIAFESEFAQYVGQEVEATSVSSATAGLYLAYAALGVGPGAEVIVPALTHVATAHAAHALGASVRFADVELASGNVSVQQISALLTSATKVICVVHYLGLPVDMGPILNLAHDHGIAVVEDCALAIGTRLEGRHAGTLGDVGVFSFYPAKHMTTGEGGMVVSGDAMLMSRVRSMKAFGYDKALSERTVPGVYDIKEFGLNMRMSEIAAAMGRVQINRLPDFAKQRSANSVQLRSRLGQVGDLHLQCAPQDHQQHSHYCEIARFPSLCREDRDKLSLAMQARGVGTSVYYPVTLPKSRFYSALPGAQQEDFPSATQFSDQSIALPVGPHLTTADMDTIADALVEALGEVTRGT